MQNYDSTFCGSLPIHQINVVQPYGVLIVFDRNSGLIVQSSENAASLFGRPISAVTGSRISDYITNDFNITSERRKGPEVCEILGTRYLAMLHAQADFSLLEINLESAEEALHGSFLDVYSELRAAIATIENSSAVTEALQMASKELKKVSGFDKVMIYQFDGDWNGHVIAEDMEAGMESYFGFTFPASDIPKQARELYMRNTYRFIPDRTYSPVKMYPVINPVTSAFLDMSDCNLRGVSSVHLEYLANMNVMASMSTGIIKQDRLWGLIACHHRSPMKVNYRICAFFEILSGIISAKITAIDNNGKHALIAALSEMYGAIVEELYRTKNLAQSLLYGNRNVLELFAAEGVVLIFRGQIWKQGSIPEDEQLEDLMLWLHSMEQDKVFVTDSVSRQFGFAIEFREVASGLMSIPLDREKEEYMLLFRPEITRLINWGGDPATRINFEKDMKTYHPRFSFKLWQEKVSGFSVAWREEEIEIAENLRHFINDFLRGNQNMG